MTNLRMSRALLSGTAGVGVAGVLALVSAPEAVASAQRPSAPGFEAVIGADAVMPFVKIPNEMVAHAAGSAVELSRQAGQAARCRAYGAGYWMGSGVESTVGDTGPGLEARVPASATVPAAPSMSLIPMGLYHNPTVTYRSNPDPGPSRTWGGGTIPSTRSPGVLVTTVPDRTIAVPLPAGPSDGVAPTWDAACPTPTRGSAVARTVQVPGIGAVVSTALARVDRRTGGYTATARTAATDVRTPTSTLDLVSSLLTVRMLPGEQPVVSYRISVAAKRIGDATSAFSDSDVVVAGTDVPAESLVDQFNTAAAAAAPAIQALLGPAGLQLVAPVVDDAGRRGHVRILAPVLTGHLGLTSREGTIGTDQGVRLGATYLDYVGPEWSGP